jgi:hypothetical protein
LGVGAAALAGVISLGAGAASAAPSNAKNGTIGTFDCGSVGSGMFVINTGNANGMSWGQAHLTFADGSTANFQPSSLMIAFTQGGQTQTQTQSKNNPKGSVTCTGHAGVGACSAWMAPWSGPSPRTPDLSRRQPADFGLG